MLSNISKYEKTIENRLYTILCPSDSPLPHVMEFLCDAVKFVGNVQDQIKAMAAQQKPADAQEQPKEVEDGKPAV